MKTLIKRLVPKHFLERYQARKVHEHHVTELAKWSPEDDQHLEFYREFVREGQVVFDVGANMGNRSKVFRRLGAKSIAFEPQPSCWAVLKDFFDGDDGFVLEPCALGAATGEASMYVSDAHTLSSLSEDWIKSVQASGRFDSYKWNKQMTVALSTLDSAIEKHGMPSFIKIDVEGFESQVIAGLSQPVDCISMEFVPERIEDTYRCIDRLDEIGMQSYRVSLWDSMQWQHDTWEDTDAIRRRLGQLGPDKWGDLFARKDQKSN